MFAWRGRLGLVAPTQRDKVFHAAYFQRFRGVPGHPYEV